MPHPWRMWHMLGLCKFSKKASDISQLHVWLLWWGHQVQGQWEWPVPGCCFCSAGGLWWKSCKALEHLRTSSEKIMSLGRSLYSLLPTKSRLQGLRDSCILFANGKEYPWMRYWCKWVHLIMAWEKQWADTGGRFTSGFSTAPQKKSGKHRWWE